MVDTLYTKELGDKICQLIAQGQSLRAIAVLDDMPSKATILYWLVRGDRGEELYVAFSDQYARARAAQAEGFMDELLEIADIEEDVQRAKLKIDTRKWAMSKFVSKKYGDKITAEHIGKDGGPIETKETSTLEVARKIAFVLASASKDQ